MKKTLVVAAISTLVSTSALAADNGFYMGAQAGYGDIGYSQNDITVTPASVSAWLDQNLVSNNNWDNAYDFQAASLAPTGSSSSGSSSSNYAGRLFLGYQFNSYLALEAGYTHFFENVNENATYYSAGQIARGGALEPTIFYNYYNATGVVNINHQISENAADLDVKLIYPIPNTHFNVYTKIGAAYVDPEVSSNVQSVTVNAQGLDSSQIVINNNYGGDLHINSSICPVIAPGISYDFTNHISADASWMVIVGEGSVKTANFASLGVTYHF